jgi:bifunctional UDP-N-acetylglucosamine pyrophosphorylase / glucosamine-1-phosphate N-acetyltransferase
VAQEQPSLAAIVLAAGKGTRMKSQKPKVLHPVLGEPMLFHSLRAVAQAGIPPERTVIVIGHEAAQVRQAVAARGPYLFAEQPEQLGTGHAVQMARTALQSLAIPATHILVNYGDNGLLRSQTLRQLITHHLQTQPLVTMATTEIPDPTGYGRIIRDPATGRFRAIVEQPDLTPDQLPIKEANPGLYVFQAEWLWATLPNLRLSLKGEYYLTDLPGFAVEALANSVETVLIDHQETLGINDRVQLAEVSNILRQRILRDWMLAGVTITDPATTYISAESQIGPDTIIEPNTHLQGRCQIGSDCVIGPNSILTEAQLGDRCRILASVIENSTLEDDISVGPFSRVRPGCHLESGVYMGNFAEASRSRLGSGSKQGHVSFVGDATLGPNVNVGAGVITANYDGLNKNKSIIGAGAFLGCDTVLRAPVTIGDNAVTGAGAIVLKDVAPGTKVVGLPAKPIRASSDEAKPE